MNKINNQNNTKSKIWKGILFVLFAVPGALIAVFAGLLLIGTFFLPKDRLPTNPIIFVLALIIGTFMTLLGLGKIREWIYGLVFISIPLSFWLFVLINPQSIGGTSAIFLFIGIVAFIMLRLVRNYYQKRKF